MVESKLPIEESPPTEILPIETDNVSSIDSYVESLIAVNVAVPVDDSAEIVIELANE